MEQVRFQNKYIIRGHHLLCLLGFKGYGYSKAFVENMRIISTQINAEPDSVILKVVERPDDICTSCPHLGENGCLQNGPNSEDMVRKRDNRVVHALNLIPEGFLSWSSIILRIKEHITPFDLPFLCGDCKWLAGGYCQDGLNSIKKV